MSLERLRNRKKSVEYNNQSVDQPSVQQPKEVQYTPQPQQPVYHQQVQPTQQFGYQRPGAMQPKIQIDEPSTAIISIEDKEQYLRERLGIDPTEQIVVYEEPSIEVAALDFEIRDINGRIAQKVLKVEKDTGLHVIPFKLAGLNKMVTEILGYNIFELDGEKYASAIDHQVNDGLIKQYEDRWTTVLQTGEPVNENLVITENLPGYGVVKTVALNQFEIKYLMGRFRNYGVIPFSTENSVIFTIGE